MTDSETPRIPFPVPGPYRIERDADGVDDVLVICTADGEHEVARVIFWDCNSGWAMRALGNALFLAAAPDLLLALRKLVHTVAELPQPIGDELAQAVSEAEGYLLRFDQKRD